MVVFCKYRLLKPCPHRACLHDKTAPRQSYVQFSGTLQQVHLRRLSGMSVLEERLRDLSLLLNGTERLRDFVEQRRLRLREFGTKYFWIKTVLTRKTMMQLTYMYKDRKRLKIWQFWSMTPCYKVDRVFVDSSWSGIGGWYSPFLPTQAWKSNLLPKCFRAVDRGWRHMSRPFSI